MPMHGFTRRYISPASPPQLVSGLITGFHDTSTTHLDMISAIAGAGHLEMAYAAAQVRDYLWHELGDTHLILA